MLLKISGGVQVLKGLLVKALFAEQFPKAVLEQPRRHCASMRDRSEDSRSDALATASESLRPRSSVPTAGALS